MTDTEHEAHARMLDILFRRLRRNHVGFTGPSEMPLTLCDECGKFVEHMLLHMMAIHPTEPCEQASQEAVDTTE